MRKAIQILLPFVLGACVLPLPASADVTVVRDVHADAFAGPVKGSQTACAEAVEAPKQGDEVRLSVRARQARRDEPGLSVIVDLDQKRAYVLNHGTRTYSVLKYPPRLEDVADAFRLSLGDSAAEVFDFQPDGDIAVEALDVAGRAASRRSVSLQSMLLSQHDVEADVAPDADLGEAAFAVETLTQAVRTSGQAWLALLGEEGGLPLSLRQSKHLPSTVVQYREELASLEEGELDAALFTPPSNYSKVDHEPTCF